MEFGLDFVNSATRAVAAATVVWLGILDWRPITECISTTLLMYQSTDARIGLKFGQFGLILDKVVLEFLRKIKSKNGS